MNHFKRWMFFGMMFCIACPAAWANVMWPGLFLETRLIAWPVILISLAIEYLVVRKLTGFSPGRSVYVALNMNIASALLGLVLIPLVSFAFEVFPGIVLHQWLGLTLYHLTLTALTGIAAVYLNAVIEMFSLVWMFKVTRGKRLFWWIWFANLITVFIGIAGFLAEVH